LARPVARRDHDCELSQPWRLAGAPADVVRHCLEFGGEVGAAHIDLEGRVPQRGGVVAWRVLQALDISLLGGAELVRIEPWIALLREGGDRQCASYGNKHGLQQMPHCSLPSFNIELYTPRSLIRHFFKSSCLGVANQECEPHLCLAIFRLNWQQTPFIPAQAG